jgi:uncharacterized protein with HEPN domain
MRKEPGIFMEHILECIELIEYYTEDLTKDEFLNSVLLQDAIIRRIEIIGEAIKNLPDDLKTEYPQVPWKSIAGMRDIVVHEYFGIDLNLTWKVVKRDIPSLKEKILEIKEDLDKKV